MKLKRNPKSLLITEEPPLPSLPKTYDDDIHRQQQQRPRRLITRRKEITAADLAQREEELKALKKT